MSKSHLHETPTAADEAHREMVRQARRYLHNAIREPRATCRVCTAPVNNFDQCWQCRQQARVSGLADLVLPLTYAVAGTASANLMHRYKNHPTRSVRDEHSRIIAWLLQFGVARHEQCIAGAVGLPVSLRLTIPSLTGRQQPPLRDIARQLGDVDHPSALRATPGATCDRTINDKFALHPPARLDGRHVLILDDTWTTGANAQSAALTLRRAGAAAISVMVVARWLNPQHEPVAQFVQTRLQRDYDPACCPVTGADCPKLAIGPRRPACRLEDGQRSATSLA